MVHAKNTKLRLILLKLCTENSFFPDTVYSVLSGRRRRNETYTLCAIEKSPDFMISYSSGHRGYHSSLRYGCNRLCDMAV